MRLFVAITPSAAALDELDAAVAPHRPAWPELRWTSPEAWHITLAFLGEVDEVTDQLTTRLERAAGRHHSLELSPAGAGAFPAGARARVLWTGIAGDQEALGGLAASVAAGARRAGAPPPDEGRKFRPHITLARCRAPADVRLLVAALTDYAGPSWPADRIHLIRSHLGTSPRYDTVASWPLRPA
ncbi:MAG TPA: RNA 2',3'-cyclic phosphodiesterase [Streptosporangiaceae bacterium]